MLLCHVITRSALLYPLDAVPYPTQNGAVFLRDLAIHSLNNSSEGTTREPVVGWKQFLNLGCSEGLSGCLQIFRFRQAGLLPTRHIRRSHSPHVSKQTEVERANVLEVAGKMPESAAKRCFCAVVSQCSFHHVTAQHSLNKSLQNAMQRTTRCCIACCGSACLNGSI